VKKRAGWFCIAAGISWLTAAFAASDPEPAATPAGGKALLIQLEDAIGPGTSHYIRRGIERARTDGYAAVILQIDTPGGLESSMRDIIKEILAPPSR
jgi:membrane-bound serine protease (ClpP class)